MPLAVVGEFTSCVYPWLHIKLTILLSVRCETSSLKSPRTTHGMLDTETRVSIVDIKLVNVCSGVLGDLYNSAIWIGVLFGNNRVVVTASMPLDAYLCVQVGCMSSGRLIITPPLLSPDALSHLIAIWAFCSTGEG